MVLNGDSHALAGGAIADLAQRRDRPLPKHVRRLAGGFVAGEHANDAGTKLLTKPAQRLDVADLHFQHGHFGRHGRPEIDICPDYRTCQSRNLQFVAECGQQSLVGVERREVWPLSSKHHRIKIQLRCATYEGSQI
jgi:hypothetical protein